MMAAKRSAGVIPEVNLDGIKLATLVFKPRGDVTKKPKQDYQWSIKKDLHPPKNNGFSERVGVGIIEIWLMVFTCCMMDPGWGHY